MTISTEVSQVTSTQQINRFQFDFRFDDPDHLEVIVENSALASPPPDTLLRGDIDYTLETTEGVRGGAVVLREVANAAWQTVTGGVARLKTGWTITIQRKIPLLQGIELEDSGPFFARTHELAFDRLVMMIQQVERDAVGRVVDTVREHLFNIQDDRSIEKNGQGQLKVKLDGPTITESADGVRVSADLAKDNFLRDLADAPDTAPFRLIFSDGGSIGPQDLLSIDPSKIYRIRKAGRGTAGTQARTLSWRVRAGSEGFHLIVRNDYTNSANVGVPVNFVVDVLNHSDTRLAMLTISLAVGESAEIFYDPLAATAERLTFERLADRVGLNMRSLLVSKGLSVIGGALVNTEVAARGTQNVDAPGNVDLDAEGSAYGEFIVNMHSFPAAETNREVVIRLQRIVSEGNYFVVVIQPPEGRVNVRFDLGRAEITWSSARTEVRSGPGPTDAEGNIPKGLRTVAEFLVSNPADVTGLIHGAGTGVGGGDAFTDEELDALFEVDTPRRVLEDNTRLLFKYHRDRVENHPFAARYVTDEDDTAATNYGARVDGVHAGYTPRIITDGAAMNPKDIAAIYATDKVGSVGLGDNTFNLTGNQRINLLLADREGVEHQGALIITPYHVTLLTAQNIQTLTLRRFNVRNFREENEQAEWQEDVGIFDGRLRSGYRLSTNYFASATDAAALDLTGKRLYIQPLQTRNDEGEIVDSYRIAFREFHVDTSAITDDLHGDSIANLFKGFLDKVDPAYHTSIRATIANAINNSTRIDQIIKALAEIGDRPGNLNNASMIDFINRLPATVDGDTIEGIAAIVRSATGTGELEPSQNPSEQTILFGIDNDALVALPPKLLSDNEITGNIYSLTGVNGKSFDYTIPGVGRVSISLGSRVGIRALQAYPIRVNPTQGLAANDVGHDISLVYVHRDRALMIIDNDLETFPAASGNPAVRPALNLRASYIPWDDTAGRQQTNLITRTEEAAWEDFATARQDRRIEIQDAAAKGCFWQEEDHEMDDPSDPNRGSPAEAFRLWVEEWIKVDRVIKAARDAARSGVAGVLVTNPLNPFGDLLPTPTITSEDRAGNVFEVQFAGHIRNNQVPNVVRGTSGGNPITTLRHPTPPSIKFIVADILQPPFALTLTDLREGEIISHSLKKYVPRVGGGGSDSERGHFSSIDARALHIGERNASLSWVCNSQEAANDRILAPGFNVTDATPVIQGSFSVMVGGRVVPAAFLVGAFSGQADFYLVFPPGVSLPRWDASRHPIGIRDAVDGSVLHLFNYASYQGIPTWNGVVVPSAQALPCRGRGVNDNILRKYNLTLPKGIEFFCESFADMGIEIVSRPAIKREFLLNKTLAALFTASSIPLRYEVIEDFRIVLPENHGLRTVTLTGNFQPVGGLTGGQGIYYSTTPNKINPVTSNAGSEGWTTGRFVQANGQQTITASITDTARTIIAVTYRLSGGASGDAPYRSVAAGATFSIT